MTTTEKKSEDILPYVSTYFPNDTEMFGILKGISHILTNDQTMREALSTSKIIKSKRQHPNLKKIVTKAKFADQASQATHKVFRCKRPNCALCNYLAEGQVFN